MDSFKGALSASEAGASVAAGLTQAWSLLRPNEPPLRCVNLPLADGGEGLIDCLRPLLEAQGFRAVTLPVQRANLYQPAVTAKQGGYARLLWQSLVPVDAGAAGDESAYLNALLVSSPEYLKRLCAGDKLPGPHYFMKKTGRFVRAPETGYRVLPIWAQWAPAPLKLDAADFAAKFNWQARGSSTLSLLDGATLTLTYGDLGLAYGPWHLYLKDTGEHGTMEQGKLTSTLTFDLYQDGRARFPSAIFTVNLLTGEFEGPYQLIYDISELFDQGYHAVLLEECGDIKTEHGFKTLKRIADYKPGSYLKEQGTYVKGEPQVQQRFKLKRYQRPYYRSSFRYAHYGYYRSRY